MRKLLIIARANMRRAKGQTAAIVALMLIAALMLNLWLMLSMDYKANFDRYHTQLNAEHVTLSVDGDGDEARSFLDKTLKSDNRVSEYRMDGCMNMTGTFPYNGGQMNGWFVFLEKSVALTRTVGRAEIVEDGGGESGVYLPMLYRSEEIAVGKSVELTIGSTPVKYTVCGFSTAL